MEIRINDVIVNVSDENQELLYELMDRIISEDISSKTGNEDFSIANTNIDCRATLNIEHDFLGEDEPSDSRSFRAEGNADDFTEADMKKAFE